METTASFGYWVRRQRKALDLTQQVLAERVGCSLAAIKKIESEERRPSRQIAERLADILAVPADQRGRFLESARGLRPVEQLGMANEPAVTSLPTGTVTLLFTDIEGSTRLWGQHPEAMALSSARHDQILRGAIRSNNGHLFQVAGDSFCAAFHTAGEAVRAALESQVELQREDWGEAVIRVRMGIHTGDAEVEPDGAYRGYVTLSHAQRLMAAGHGGQVLMSFATQELAKDGLPGGTELRNLGEHRLKNFDRAEPIFQLAAPNLPSDFPPIDTLSAFPNNLPAQLTSFIGRGRELDELKQLLANTRLLTLTGPGGTGKTRLALQFAAEELKSFAHGTWLVELAPLSDPTLVPQAIAGTLGVREQPGRTILEALTDYVRAKSLLIVLDNCEHLIEACARIADALLRAAPGLKILASSREALGIAGETSYRVPSLPQPDPRPHYDLEALSQNDCVRLFVDRALATYPSFRLKEKNAPAIADICRRLDGIPLAIELAAARTKVFPPDQIAARLDDRFRLLTGGSRAALERHQTLFALIDWSHNLLSAREQALLRGLSVFAGGWSLEAAQAICGDGSAEEVLDTVAHLADKSLVMVEEPGEAAEGRYRLLETIRQYARDRLLESGEAEQVRDRHLSYFLKFAQAAEPRLRGKDQLDWLDRLETEHDNLRTALGWSLESKKGKTGLELAGSLGYFWILRGYFSEGQKWLDDALALAGPETGLQDATGVRDESTAGQMRQSAKALYADAWLQMATLSITNGQQTLERSLRLWRELGDKWWMAMALELKGLLWSSRANHQLAIACLEEAVSLARQLDDPWPLAACLIRLGDVVKMVDLETAKGYLEEGVALARGIGDRNVLSEGLRELASVHFAPESLAVAARLTEEALEEARAIGTMIPIFLALSQLVGISCLQNDLAEAKAHCMELWSLARETGLQLVAGLGILTASVTACSGEDPLQGARLFAAAQTLLGKAGLKFNTPEGGPLTAMFRRALETAKGQLGLAAFDAAWAQGEQMTFDEAVAATEKFLK